MFFELMVHGANVDLQLKVITSLHLAAVKDHMEVVQRLLNHGAIVDFADTEGCSALPYIRSRMPLGSCYTAAESWC